MIDLTQSYCKVSAFLKQLHLHPDILHSKESLEKHEAFEAIEALYDLEKRKEEYKKVLTDKYTLNSLYERERSIVREMLSSFEKDEKEFCREVLKLNPLVIFHKSPFIFFVQDGKNIIHMKRETDYIFIPKSMATGNLRIDDIAIGGGLKFLLSLKTYNKPFTINDLTINKGLNISLVINNVKKLMLYQSIIIA